jgi:accessory gene regulator protein AgrB
MKHEDGSIKSTILVFLIAMAAMYISSPSEGMFYFLSFVFVLGLPIMIILQSSADKKTNQAIKNTTAQKIDPHWKRNSIIICLVAVAIIIAGMLHKP